MTVPSFFGVIPGYTPVVMLFTTQFTLYHSVAIIWLATDGTYVNTEGINNWVVNSFFLFCENA